MENVQNLKHSGVLVCLTASPEEITRRVADDRHRPLLNVPDRVAVVREMMERRSLSYQVLRRYGRYGRQERRCRRPGGSRRLLEVSGGMERVTVELGDRSYPILIGSGILIGDRRLSADRRRLYPHQPAGRSAVRRSSTRRCREGGGHGSYHHRTRRRDVEGFHAPSRGIRRVVTQRGAAQDAAYRVGRRCNRGPGRLCRGDIHAWDTLCADPDDPSCAG